MNRGYFLHRLAACVCSPENLEHVVDPAIADLQRDEQVFPMRSYLAVVTVIVEDFSGNRVYVIGQVTKPGMFVMNPSLTVLQALSLAGGATPFAKLDNISIIRGTGASQKTLPFRYGQVVEGKSLQQNVTLESGDVVVVP